MSDESKELAVTQSALPALPDPNTLREIFETNFEGVTPSFPVIKMPTGGMTVWAVPTDEGEPDIEKELVGVVLDHYGVRTYWEGAYTSGKTPPKCFSTDLKHGSLPRNENGEFGECGTHLDDTDPRKCKWARFGTKIKQNGNAGRGQACSVRKRVFLLMPDRSIFPFMVALSVTSATKTFDGSFSTYTVKLGGKLKKITDVTTKIKLILGGEDEDGNKYSVAAFYFVSDLNEEEKKKVDSLRTMFKPAMRNRPIEADEAETNGNSSNGAPSEKKDPWDSPEYKG